MPNQLPQIDSHIRVVTPENIAFEYRVASPFERAVAYLIDMFIMVLLVLAVGFLAFLVFGFLGLEEVGLGMAAIIQFSVAWFYGGVFETFWSGQTPGKRSMGLRVVRVDGSPINAGQAVLRNFLRLVDGLPALTLAVFPVSSYLVGLLTTSMNRRYQRLGDLACGTMVIAEDRSRATKFNEITDVMLGPVEDLLPPGALPSRTLAKAISQYVERRRYFGPERRAEIAGHVGELFAEQHNLPEGIDYDILLCVLYRRAFLSANQEDDIVLEPLLPEGQVGTNPVLAPAQPREFEPPR